MTLTEAEVELLRKENRVGLATLAEVPNLVDLLWSPAMGGELNSGRVWWLMSSDDYDHFLPMLVVGVRGDVGFLRWHAGPHEMYVPAGVEYRDGGQAYFHGGYDHDAIEGEEIPVYHVLAAAAQFVATGQRPTCLQWINDDDVPHLRTPPPPLEEDPIYLAIKAAVDGSPGE